MEWIEELSDWIHTTMVQIGTIWIFNRGEIGFFLFFSSVTLSFFFLFSSPFHWAGWQLSGRRWKLMLLQLCLRFCGWNLNMNFCSMCMNFCKQITLKILKTFSVWVNSPLCHVSFENETHTVQNIQSPYINSILLYVLFFSKGRPFQMDSDQFKWKN
jgi:hypothetical protein